MPSFTQAERPLRITTPLGADQLLITGLEGSDAISALFRFEVDLLAENKTSVAFEKLLGQAVTVEMALPDKKKRHFNGIVSRFSQGERDETFTAYRAEIVPRFWLLTRKAQSRIFQHMNVPDILKKVLQELDVTYELRTTYHPRDYCVQYRETDFEFASRLMEEEGIFYFFKHSDGAHQMVVADTPPSHPDLPEVAKVIFEKVIGGTREEDRIFEWEKVQELRSGKTTLWDHCFELPHKHLEADKKVTDSLEVGKVTHKLEVGGNGKLELYDFPGGYAGRFDGVAPGGGDRPADVQKIFEDNARTVEIRMQQETLPAMRIEGTSNCREFVSGHKFSLERHFDGDGKYVLTRVTHKAVFDAYRSGSEEMSYSNAFTCIPLALPFRPVRATARPTVRGAQTAVVVGPPGDEIFTDKYGRVKVQFHWDREGKNNADSSCWIRVSTLWAGKQWGMIHLPRIGQEVVVDFVEGDPDQPLIVGSVYNADMMPPFKLPDNKTQSGVLTRSSLKGSPENCNELCFEDKKGAEFIYLRAEKNLQISVENDEIYWVGHDRSDEVDNDEVTTIGHDRTETVGNNETITIGSNRTETVGKDETISIGANRTENVGKDETISIGANRTENVGKDESVTVGKNQTVTIGENVSETVGKSQTIKIGKTLKIEVGDEIVLKTGAASITMKKDGTINIKGKDITIDGSGKISAKASMDMTLKGSKIAIN